MQRILVIEDESSIADNILYALKKEGFEVIWCANGRDGMKAFGEGGVDFIVLDVGLPDANGFEICKAVRSTSQVPLLFLTSRTEEIDRIVGLEIGADDYVQKPFSPRELSARIKTILRRSAPVETQSTEKDDVNGRGELLEVSGLSFNPGTMAISFQGENLDLSRYELRVLKVLMEKPSWVYSREQLMEAAWEEPGVSLDRTVDTHIKTLRRKLRAIDPSSDIIVTHRGLGYSIRNL